MQYRWSGAIRRAAPPRVAHTCVLSACRARAGTRLVWTKTTPTVIAQISPPMRLSRSGQSLLLRRQRGGTGEARYCLRYQKRCRRGRLSVGGTHRHPRSGHSGGVRLLQASRCAERTNTDHGTDCDNGEKLDVTCFHAGSLPSTPDFLSLCPVDRMPEPDYSLGAEGRYLAELDASVSLIHIVDTNSDGASARAAAHHHADTGHTKNHKPTPHSRRGRRMLSRRTPRLIPATDRSAE
jgi:hypothetical protein